MNIQPVHFAADFQGLERRPLGNRGGGIDHPAVDGLHRRPDGLRGDQDAHPPAGHHEILGKAVEGDRPFLHAGQGGKGDKGAAEQVLGVNFVGQDQQVMHLCDVRQGLEGFPGVHRTGRVGRVIQNDGLGPAGNGGLQGVFVNGPAVLGLCRHLHAHAARQFNLRAVDGKVRAKDDHLVARVDQGEHQQAHPQAAGGGDQHIFPVQLLAVVLPPGVHHGGNQLRVPLGIPVMGVAVLGVLKGGGDDARIGGKVRIADAQVDQVRVFALELRDAEIHGDGFLDPPGEMLHGASFKLPAGWASRCFRWG